MYNNLLTLQFTMLKMINMSINISTTSTRNRKSVYQCLNMKMANHQIIRRNNTSHFLSLYFMIHLFWCGISPKVHALTQSSIGPINIIKVTLRCSGAQSSLGLCDSSHFRAGIHYHDHLRLLMRSFDGIKFGPRLHEVYQLLCGGVNQGMESRLTPINTQVD
jgi:hypothetical protein